MWEIGIRLSGGSKAIREAECREIQRRGIAAGLQVSSMRKGASDKKMEAALRCSFLATKSE